MRAVNLLPDVRNDAQLRGVASTRTPRIVAIAAAVLLVLVSAFVANAFAQAKRGVEHKRDALTVLQRDVAAAQQALATPPATLDEGQARLAAVSAASSSRFAWDALLYDLSRVLPRGAWLSTLTAQSPMAGVSTAGAAAPAPPAAAPPAAGAPAPAAVPTAFTVVGYAVSQEVVANVLDRLALIPALVDVSLQQTQQADVAGQQVVQFTIGANVRATGGTG